MVNVKKILVSAIAIAMAGCAGQAKQEEVKVALTDGTYNATATGHNGPIEVSVKVEGGKVTDVQCVSNVETKGIGSLAIEKVVAAALENQTANIDFATGATISSAATVSAIKDALKQAGATDEMLKAGEKVVINMVLDKTDYTYDVVVVGAGGAGLSAAVEAASNGAKVVVLEKTSQIGGNTLVSGGGINIPGTDLQEKHGIEDSVEKYKEDTLKGGDNLGNPELVETLAMNALSAYEWLKNDIQMEFIQERVQQFGGHSVPRACIPVGNSGYEMMSKLEKVAMEKGVDIFKNTKAEELTKDEAGAVTGVIAENNGNKITIKAEKAVVLASGGFGSNLEMREQYNPNYGKKYKTTCISASSGDGIRLAESMGAELVDMSQIQVYPTCNPITGIISYVANARFDGAVLVNQEGKRFIDDMNRRDVVSNGILAQPGEYAYLLWGQEIESVGKMTQLHEKEFNNLMNSGLLVVADSLEELAKAAEIDPAQLQETVTKYNEMVVAGEDSELHRGGKLRPIAEGPFYLQKVAPATHHTMGGIKIDTNAQVLNTEGQVIENLFAAGEVTGGVHGSNRLGGNAITDIVVFGRIAGQNAAK